MIWYWIAGAMFALAAAILIANFIRDRTYERKKVSETFSPGLRKEVDEERAEGLVRRKKFEEALIKARESKP